MKKIKLFAMAVAALLCGSAMAADPTYESQDWGQNDYASVVTTHDNITIQATVKNHGFVGNLSGSYYMALAGRVEGTKADTNSITIFSTSKIDSIAVFYLPNSTGQETSVSWIGWNEGVTPSAAVNGHGESTGFQVSEKSYTNAQWETLDLSANDMYTVRLGRAFKNFTENDAKVEFGKNQTVNVLGLKIWVEETGEKYAAHFTSDHGTAPADTSVASIKLPELKAEGFLHLGWTADQKVKVGEDSIAAGELLANDVKVGLGQATNFTAVWTAAFTVSYYNGENLLGSEKVISGEKPVESALYETIEHMTFVGWFDETGLMNINPADSVITSDANFYGQWSGEVAQSASINIEQIVLDFGTKFNIKDSLTANNIGYADIDALDSLNDAKDARNEPYLGLKIKTAGGYMEMGLKANDVLRVKFGHVDADLALTINGVESTLAKADATIYEYTATEDCWVKIATTTKGTVVFKQIMINENIQEVILPVSPTPTALRNIMTNAKAQKFMRNGAVYFRHNAKVFNMMGQEIRF